MQLAHYWLTISLSYRVINGITGIRQRKIYGPGIVKEIACLGPSAQLRLLNHFAMARAPAVPNHHTIVFIHRMSPSNR